MGFRGVFTDGEITCFVNGEGRPGRTAGYSASGCFDGWAAAKAGIAIELS